MRFLFRAVTASTSTAGVLSLTIYKLLDPPSDYSKCRTFGSRNIKVLNVAKPQCMSLKGIPCRRTFLRASSLAARFHHPHKTVNSRKNTATCALRLLRRVAGLLCEIETVSTETAPMHRGVSRKLAFIFLLTDVVARCTTSVVLLLVAVPVGQLAAAAGWMRGPHSACYRSCFNNAKDTIWSDLQARTVSVILLYWFHAYAVSASQLRFLGQGTHLTGCLAMDQTFCVRWSKLTILALRLYSFVYEKLFNISPNRKDSVIS